MNGTKYAEIGSSPTKGTAANVEIKFAACSWQFEEQMESGTNNRQVNRQ